MTCTREREEFGGLSPRWRVGPPDLHGRCDILSRHHGPRCDAPRACGPSVLRMGGRACARACGPRHKAGSRRPRVPALASSSQRTHSGDGRPPPRPRHSPSRLRAHASRAAMPTGGGVNAFGRDLEERDERMFARRALEPALRTTTPTATPPRRMRRRTTSPAAAAGARRRRQPRRWRRR